MTKPGSELDLGNLKTDGRSGPEKYGKILCMCIFLLNTILAAISMTIYSNAFP